MTSPTNFSELVTQCKECLTVAGHLVSNNYAKQLVKTLSTIFSDIFPEVDTWDYKLLVSNSILVRHGIEKYKKNKGKIAHLRTFMRNQGVDYNTLFPRKGPIPPLPGNNQIAPPTEPEGEPVPTNQTEEERAKQQEVEDELRKQSLIVREAAINKERGIEEIVVVKKKNDPEFQKIVDIMWNKIKNGTRSVKLYAKAITDINNGAVSPKPVSNPSNTCSVLNGPSSQSSGGVVRFDNSDQSWNFTTCIRKCHEKVPHKEDMKRYSDAVSCYLREITYTKLKDGRSIEVFKDGRFDIRYFMINPIANISRFVRVYKGGDEKGTIKEIFTAINYLLQTNFYTNLAKLYHPEYVLRFLKNTPHESEILEGEALYKNIDDKTKEICKAMLDQTENRSKDMMLSEMTLLPEYLIKEQAGSDTKTHYYIPNKAGKKILLRISVLLHKERYNKHFKDYIQHQHATTFKYVNELHEYVGDNTIEYKSLDKCVQAYIKTVKGDELHMKETTLTKNLRIWTATNIRFTLKMLFLELYPAYERVCVEDTEKALELFMSKVGKLEGDYNKYRKGAKTTKELKFKLSEL